MTTTEAEKQVRAERERCRQLFLEHLDCVYGSVLRDPTVAESTRSTLEAIESGAPYDEKLEFIESRSRETPWPVIQPIRVTPRADSPAGKTAPSTEDILTAMADAVSPLPPKPATPTLALAPRCSLCEAPVLPRYDGGTGYQCDCASHSFWSEDDYRRLLANRLAEQQKGGQ